MKKFLLAALILVSAMVSSAPAFADHVYVGVGVGGGYGYPGYYHRPWGPGPYYDYGYYGRPAYYYPGYYSYYPYYPYAAPPTAVVYQPAPAPVVTTPAVATPAPVSANPASQTYTDGAGRTCREYQSTSTIGGNEEQTYGTACLQPDGTWRVISQQ